MTVFALCHQLSFISSVSLCYLTMCMHLARRPARCLIITMCVCTGIVIIWSQMIPSQTSSVARIMCVYFDVRVKSHGPKKKKKGRCMRTACLRSYSGVCLQGNRDANSRCPSFKLFSHCVRTRAQLNQREKKLNILPVIT